MYFDLIHANLKSLSLQTALLEACDWDDCRVEKVVLEVDEYLRFLNPGYFNSWDEIQQDISNHLTNTFNKHISDIIINIVNLNKNDFKNLMELPEQ
jgi:hypothetical protein